MSTNAERVGRYQLLEPIGVGPCGSVSRAKVFGVAGFERQFAIKRFHPELTTNTATAQALSAAARGYGSLEHPRIARMSEFGVAHGTTFTAVEYVAGLDALRLIAEAKLGGTSLAAGGALALVSQAARAIGYAHGRGLSHLGLSPTNVIVTAEGDIKITDFGILSSTLPPRPIDAMRLAHRVQYLAPEQLANEATSAATDVFALGVLAYELVTGQRTFRGDTPRQIADAVMAGPPAELPLPRPIVRVLQRCLARSPFERFPDARALADALDAALRVAPVPGTRKDIGAQVSHTLERLAAIHEGELSGMLAVDLATGPITREAPVPVAMLGRDNVTDPVDVSTLEFVRPDTPVAGPTPLVGPQSTVPDLPKPFTTMAGLAPPPIPVPQGVLPPTGAPARPTPPPGGGPNTLLGVPSIKPPPTPVGKLNLAKAARPPSTPVPSIPPVSKAGGRAPTRLDSEGPTRSGTELDPPERSSREIVTDPGLGRGRSNSDFPHDQRTSEMAPVMVEQLKAATTPAAADPSGNPLDDLTGEPSGEPWTQATVLELTEPPPAFSTTLAGIAPPPRGNPMAGSSAPFELGPYPAEYAPAHDADRASARQPTEDDIVLSQPQHGSAPRTFPTPAPLPAVAAKRPTQPPPVTGRTQPSERSIPTAGVTMQPSGSRLPWILASALGVAALGVGGWFAYGKLVKQDGAATGASRPALAVQATRDAGPSAPDGAQVAAVSSVTDAGAGRAVPPGPGDATVASAPIDAAAPAVAPGSPLKISSQPKGARVFLDGSDVGVTPLELPGTPDRHTIALLLPGHELYIADVDGQGTFAIPLVEVTPTGGPAGIKVIKCKDKERYYVYVDGKATGQTCPTERIETKLGPHVVEVYDVVSETRKKYEIEVKETRLSHRVRIE